MNSPKIVENLQNQLFELETLQSMFCNPGEIRIEDSEILQNINDYLENKTIVVPPFLDLTINLNIEESKFELCINLSNEYPDVEPDIFVRNHKLNKKQHADLNKELGDYVASLERGEPCIFSAVSWLQDNASNYSAADIQVQTQEVNEKVDETFERYWIYSHHIYSKSKRREISDLAKILNINGFCMPGKPGIICVEGRSSDCSEWWQTIKSMNWKRIFCKINEVCSPGDEKTFCKFRTFEEVVFQNSNIKCNHMDMGELLRYLEARQCGHIFKEIFGVEAKAVG